MPDRWNLSGINDNRWRTGYFTFVSQRNHAYSVQTSGTFGDRTPKVNFALHTFTFTSTLDIMCTPLRKDELELVQGQRRVTSTMKCVVSDIRNKWVVWGFSIWKRWLRMQKTTAKLGMAWSGKRKINLSNKNTGKNTTTSEAYRFLPFLYFSYICSSL